MKTKLLLVISLLFLMSVLTGFDSNSTSSLQQSFQTKLVPVSQIELPTKTIIGFGEATHGNKEFTTLKLDIFKYLVEKQGYRVFAIEGDFGGGQKVNEYILGGSGTAQAAAKAIGFSIYNTEEMAQLIAWMRTYNDRSDNKDKIHFYGFDMQRYDHSKNALFAYIKKVDPALAATYEAALSNLNDKTVYDQNQAIVQVGLTHSKTLLERMRENKFAYIAKSSDKDYELALIYAESIKQNATLQSAKMNYGNLRDAFMAEKVKWILSYEKKYFGREKLFITGHNGHIEKTSSSMGITTCMGVYLANAFGDNYYAIGSEFYESSFLANDATSNERKAFYVKNSGSNRLASLFANTNKQNGFLDFAKAKQDENFTAYLLKPQPISAIGAVYSGLYGKMEKMYTLQMTPAKAFDAILFVRTATPSTMLAN
ncbi:erythromycin esterase family protein [Brevibacillus reuszeri]|uniref:erythromycin esterase family protein n=1 Tax=Brevibacillus reuszeri TaxID=54915 RepID=UPI00289C00DA|nr:erythromycin esterase family protein [Brevibacillus reuszeri]